MLKIPKNIRDEMLAQARKEAPIEACGYLAGKNGQVKKLFALKNAAGSRERFSFEPKDQFRVRKEARALGLELVAVYHSHPATPARPSEEDLRLAFDPAIIYVIISLSEENPDIVGFRVKENQAIEVPIEIITNYAAYQNE